MIASRNTKYSSRLLSAIQSFGHATNAELLASLQEVFPDLSATTIHRTTTRMVERGLIRTAPPDSHGAARFDANIQPHDHFICEGCQGVRDLDVSEQLLPAINKALGGCKVTGRLIIYGSCRSCLNEGEKL
jgi:Fur family transcriptional regulator, peroxide stress response regulator